MTVIVKQELTNRVNLRHFFVPREAVPRTMVSNMRVFDCDDKTVIDYFSSDLTEKPESRMSGQHRPEINAFTIPMIYSIFVPLSGILAAAVLRGFTGFGFGLAAVPLLSLAMPPTQVVPLVVTLQVVIGVGGLRRASAECDWRAVMVLAPGLILGVPIGLLVLTALPANPVRLVIAAIIMFSVWLIWRGVRLPTDPSRLLSFGVGLTAGVISGLASMGGPVIIVYLLALGHCAARMRATAIVYFMLSGCVAFLPMMARGLITRDILVWAAASVPVLFAGSRLGTSAFHRATPRSHRTVALVTLSGLASLLVARAALG